MFADDIPDDLQNRNNFSKNHAKYFGPDYASNPFRILFLNNQSLCTKRKKLKLNDFFFLSGILQLNKLKISRDFSQLLSRK